MLGAAPGHQIGKVTAAKAVSKRPSTAQRALLQARVTTPSRVRTIREWTARDEPPHISRRLLTFLDADVLRRVYLTRRALAASAPLMDVAINQPRGTWNETHWIFITALIIASAVGSFTPVPLMAQSAIEPTPFIVASGLEGPRGLRFGPGRLSVCRRSRHWRHE